MNDVKFNILNKLKSLDVCIPSTRGIQWLVRCPFCGDSLDPTHAHLSIKIDLDSDDAMPYRCFKCNESGIVDENLLDTLSLNVEEENLSSLKKLNSKSQKNKKFIIGYSNYSVPNGSNNPNNDEKLYYINDRLGTDINYADAIEYKIVFDIFDFMKYNKIDIIEGASYKYLKFINANYVGFLSNNNARIIWRCIRKNNEMNRYLKLNIDLLNISNNNFYNINQSIDIQYTKPVNIHIAEGIFDIISIANNLERDTSCYNLYYAACGFSYITILKHILNSGIIYDNNLHIYTDNDKNIYDHLLYLDKINSNWFENIFIHSNRYNEEKDYGVKKENIVDTIKKIK